jgi:hypothetical protein
MKIIISKRKLKDSVLLEHGDLYQITVNGNRVMILNSEYNKQFYLNNNTYIKVIK